MRKLVDDKRNSYRRKLIELAETDPEAAEKLQAQKEHRNEWTRQHYAEFVAQAETDPKAAAKLADIRARRVQATQKCTAKKKELAKTAEIGKEEGSQQLCKELWNCNLNKLNKTRINDSKLIINRLK